MQIPVSPPDEKPSPDFASAAIIEGPPGSTSLADRLEDALPQTQCTKCGYPACRPYAEAMARGEAAYNQCPPGGAEGVARLAAILGRPVIPLNPVHGIERPRPVAVIDEDLCIGCTLCIQACPVDAIVGAPKLMHTVIPSLCTGCDLCVAPCPVDCIAMEDVTGTRTGWSAWSAEQARDARQRHDFRTVRLAREKQENEARLAAKAAAKLQALENDPAASAAEQTEKARKQAIIQAAIDRARARQAATGGVPTKRNTASPNDTSPASTAGSRPRQS